MHWSSSPLHHFICFSNQRLNYEDFLEKKKCFPLYCLSPKQCSFVLRLTFLCIVFYRFYIIKSFDLLNCFKDNKTQFIPTSHVLYFSSSKSNDIPKEVQIIITTWILKNLNKKLACCGPYITVSDSWSWEYFSFEKIHWLILHWFPNFQLQFHFGSSEQQ